jgi:hypothetical protein
VVKCGLLNRLPGSIPCVPKKNLYTYPVELDTIKYIHLNAHVSGLLKFEYRFMKSCTQYPAGAIYDPIIYNQKIGKAVVFYKNMLIRRQRILLLSSIEKALRISGPFSHIFLTSICDWGVIKQIIVNCNMHLCLF